MIIFVPYDSVILLAIRQLSQDIYWTSFKYTASLQTRVDQSVFTDRYNSLMHYCRI